MQDLFRDGLRISYEQRSGRSELGIEMWASHRWPSALPANLSKALRIAGKEFVFGRRRTVGDIAQRMNANLELIWRVSSAQPRFTVAVDQSPKTVRLPADDGDH